VALTDIKIKTAKPKEKDYKLSDSEGLFLLVASTGGRRWRFKYRFGGKEKLLALGTYPDISLQEARTKLRSRNMLADGIDPGAERKALKEAQVEQAAIAENTFEVVAKEWYDKFSETWEPRHAETVISRLKRDVFPSLGNRPISEIKAHDLLDVLRRVEGRGALESAHRIRMICGQVLRYAVATGRAERDCTADLRGALPLVQEKHHAALTEPTKVAALLRAIDGTMTVKCALKLAPLLFVRPGELRQIE
jgi:hypothetical protein